MSRDRIIIGVWISVLAVMCVVLLGGRYHTTSALQGAVVRTDRMTGEVVVCDGQVCWEMLSPGQELKATPPY